MNPGSCNQMTSCKCAVKYTFYVLRKVGKRGNLKSISCEQSADSLKFHQPGTYIITTGCSSQRGLKNEQQDL